MAKQLTLFKYSFATPRTRENTSGQQECLNETGCAQRNHSEASGQESQDSNAVCQQHLNSFCNTVYSKTFEGEMIRGFRDYAANRECCPLEYFVCKKPKNYM